MTTSTPSAIIDLLKKGETKMEEFKKFKLFFTTRNDCVVDIPSDVTDVYDFIVDKIVSGDLTNFINKWIDFEIEDLEFNEEEDV